MSEPARKRRRWLVPTLLALLLVILSGVVAFWGDLVSTALDPKVPFQTYDPPPARTMRPRRPGTCGPGLRPRPADRLLHRADHL